jgi:hypothetical protein
VVISVIPRRLWVQILNRRTAPQTLSWRRIHALDLTIHHAAFTRNEHLALQRKVIMLNSIFVQSDSPTYLRNQYCMYTFLLTEHVINVAYLMGSMQLHGFAKWNGRVSKCKCPLCYYIELNQAFSLSAVVKCFNSNALIHLQRGQVKCPSFVPGIRF